MIKVRKDGMKKIRDFFEGIEDSMVIACLQGHMGTAWVRSWEKTRAAMIISGEYSFFGGDAGSEDAAYLISRVLRFTESSCSTAIFSDQQPEWETVLMMCKQNHPKIVRRFGIVQKDYNFDGDRLSAYVQAVPENYVLQRFDAELYTQAMSEAWSREFCETFNSAEDFLRRGFGYAAVKEGMLTAGASTMTVYDGGVEIQVATHESHRRKGLACACAAALILECENRGIRPCWDAANHISKNMAMTLGYEYKGEYSTVYMHR